MQRPWRIAAFWLAPCVLLSLLSYAGEDHLPSGSTVQYGLGLPSSVISQENVPQVHLLGSLGGVFSFEVPFFPYHPSLC